MDTDSPSELVRKMRGLDALKDKLAQRMNSFKNDEEKREADSLIQRAFSDECEFDRKHRLELLTLVIAPNELGWYFRLRERFHRLIRHH
jgi:hypothetical protein